MRILYGVQGTGNGHLSRARAMARAFATHPGVRVEWLFSGRPRADFFDMACFGDWQWRRGLTFVTRGGRVQRRATLRQLRAGEFLRDLRALRPEAYDLVVTDFEPLTAWAARLRSRECIGIGHQYALVPGVPLAGRIGVGSALLRGFAPVDTRIGLHWHHFGHAILPPIVDLEHDAHADGAEGSVLVYLPFEDTARVIALLEGIPGRRFDVFAPGLTSGARGNLQLHPPGRASFVAALARASHVICNCGFELVSEALHLGKRVLASPLRGQLEQLSNAITLERFGLARISQVLDRRAIEDFLDARHRAPQSRYPDVAAAVASWIVARDRTLGELADALWGATVDGPVAGISRPLRTPSAPVHAGA